MIKIMILTGFVFSYLIAAAASLEDYRTMHVNIKKCLAFVIVNILLAIGLNQSLPYCLAGLLPALLLFGANCISAGIIGNADLYLIAGAGVILGCWGIVFMLLAALLSGYIAGRILLYKNQEYTTCSIPFVPFLSFFYVVWTLPYVFSQL